MAVRVHVINKDAWWEGCVEIISSDFGNVCLSSSVLVSLEIVQSSESWLAMPLSQYIYFLFFLQSEKKEIRENKKKVQRAVF